MQLSIHACLLLGLAFAAAAGPTAKAAPTTAANKAPVPLPPVTTVDLPTPHGLPGLTKQTQPLSCGKLDACLAEAGQAGKDQEKSASSFKACLQNFCTELYGKNPAFNKSDVNRTALCDEKGKEAWFLITQAAAHVNFDGLKLKSKPQASLVAMRSQRPNIYKAVLRVFFSYTKASSMLQIHVTQTQMSDACHVPVPAKPSATLPTPHGHPEAGAVQTVQVHTPVPAKTSVKLPTPHGHPEAGSVQTTKAEAARAEPFSCQKLDACLAEAGGANEEETAAKFKACFKSFCEEVHADKDLNKSDSRTALCDEKGKEAWDVLAKANADVQAKLTGGKKTQASLVAVRSLALRSQRPDTYAAVLRVLFAQSSKESKMADVCSVGAPLRTALRH